MGKKFRKWTPDQLWLLPPSPRADQRPLLSSHCGRSTEPKLASYALHISSCLVTNCSVAHSGTASNSRYPHRLQTTKSQRLQFHRNARFTSPSSNGRAVLAFESFTGSVTGHHKDHPSVDLFRRQAGMPLAAVHEGCQRRRRSVVSQALGIGDQRYDAIPVSEDWLLR
mgnify:CR=1 FL=1